MTDIAQAGRVTSEARFAISGRMAAVLPPLMAMLYPLSVWGLFASAESIRETEGITKIMILYGGAAALCCTAIPSLVSLVMLLRPAEREDKWAGARWITLLAFATPALFTVERVVFAGFRWTLDDRWVWVPIWAFLTLVAAAGREHRPRPQPAWTNRLRFAHGVSAATILAIFLIAHLGNHFIGLLGAQLHIATMDYLRVWYRSGMVEAVIVALFVFQVVSGIRLASIRQYVSNDPYRTLQVATGIGLMAFLFAHMVVVFIVARGVYGIDTNWTFATGGKIGLLGNVSNARQVPYYWFAMVVTAVHLACGLRVVLLAHGWRVTTLNRMTTGIIAAGALFATVTLAGMLGVRLG